MSKAIKKKATIFYNKVVCLPTTRYKRHMPIHAEVEIKIVSQISLMSHSSGFAPLKIKLRPNLNIYILYGPRGQLHKLTKIQIFLPEYFSSFLCSSPLTVRQAMEIDSPLISPTMDIL